MATYYVDFASGVDTNNGTSISTPWKHSPGDGNATGVPAGTTLIAGDTVLFNSAVTYKGMITPAQNGTLANRITYDGTTWGGGKAVFDLDNTFAHAFTGYASYITVKEIDFENAVRPDGNESLRGIIRITGGTYWTIQDCIFAHVTGWDVMGVEGSDSAVYADQSCIFLNGAGTDNTTIDNCEFYAIGLDGIYLFRADNTTVKNCNFGGISRGAEAGYFSVAMRITYDSNALVVQDCVFHDGWQYEGDDAGQRNHAGDWLHIYGNTGASAYPHDLLIERCLFYNDKTFNYTHGTAFSMMETGCYDITWRNNIFLNPHAYNGALLTQDAGVGQIYIYNNTFVCFAHAIDPGALAIKIGASVEDSIEVYNNIFIQYDISNVVCIHIYDTDWAGEIDYNIYYRPEDAAEVLRRASTWYNFSGWQALGCDAHGFYANPLLASVPATGATSSAGNYRLTSSSPCKNTGGDLTAEGFTSDYLEVIRPQGAGWDIGAYEYAGGDPLEAPFSKDLAMILQ